MSPASAHAQAQTDGLALVARGVGRTDVGPVGPRREATAQAELPLRRSAGDEVTRALAAVRPGEAGLQRQEAAALAAHPRNRDAHALDFAGAVGAAPAVGRAAGEHELAPRGARRAALEARARRRGVGARAD